MHAAISVPDPKKGELIILVTDAKDANRADLLAWAQHHGVPELAVPRHVIQIEAIPLLSTGKPDYRRATELAGKPSAEASH
jgi:acyl-[acyl-carrier-protein]-phospholipid O-acyltransferase/long-chain-fatty-acid--[acyl-carrier-protein] ligase